MNKLDTLDPEFKAKIEQLIQGVSQVTGRTWIVTSGGRTMAKQKVIYAQGRNGDTRPIVSNAPPGSSAHNFNLAADLAPLKLDGTIDWNVPDKMWKLMADLAVEMGLTAGYYFKSFHDAPHVEDPGWKIEQAAWKAGTLVLA